MSVRVSFVIPAEAVELEAKLEEPEGTPKGAAVLCHPHPAYGGTMDNRIVARAARAAAGAGFAALRFNFRGAGGSTGTFDGGIGEKADATAAIRWLEARYPAAPLVMAGYSFGAWVGLQAAFGEPRVAGMIGLGLPLNLYDLDFLARYARPALYIVGTEDEFCSPENLDRFERKLGTSSSVRRIPGADHFFADHAGTVQGLVSEFFLRLPADGNTL